MRSNDLRKTFTGKLLEIRTDVEAESKALRVLYEVQNSEHWLKPGRLVEGYPEAVAEEAQQAQARETRTEAGK